MGVEISWRQRGFEKCVADNGEETNYGSTEELLGHTQGLVFELWDFLVQLSVYTIYTTKN